MRTNRTAPPDLSLINIAADTPSRVIPITRKKLIYLMHPDKENVFSGYGLPLEDRYHLVGFLMIDWPYPADEEWLYRVGQEFGEFHLAYMTRAGERGIACQMKIDRESRKFLRELDNDLSELIAEKISPLLEYRPNPRFRMRWDDKTRMWVSDFDLESGPECPTK
jgi:hypothetical protein